MEVILLERMRNLGDLGDTVAVKAGFARNYLLPKGKAVSNSPVNAAKFEARRADLEKAAAAALKVAQDRVDALKGISQVVITARAGDQGKLYGSIGTREIADAITAAGADVQKSEVRLSEGVIRTTGEFDVDLQLHSDVTTVIKLVIEADAE